MLLTTHYMFEADSLCNRIAVINKGQVVAEGTPSDLKSIVADRTVVEIETFGISEDAIERVRRAPGVTSLSIEEREQAQVLLVQSAKGLELTQELLAMLDGTTVGRVAAREPTLEDAYVALVERRSRRGSSSSAGCCTSRCCLARRSTVCSVSSTRCSSRPSRSSCTERAARTRCSTRRWAPR